MTLAQDGQRLNSSMAVDSPTRATAHQQSLSGLGMVRTKDNDYDPNNCAGCGELLKEGQALVAIDRQWHMRCFRCTACTIVLNGEYMGKDGVPYCEKCYQKSFGVKCSYCTRFISGKVLQAGDNHHFHPTCARCTKCGDPFGDGEEMYLQGSAIWHPRCGPGPTEAGLILNGGGVGVSGCATSATNGTGGTGVTISNGNYTDTECDRISSSALSEMVSDCIPLPFPLLLKGCSACVAFIRTCSNILLNAIIALLFWQPCSSSFVCQYELIEYFCNLQYLHFNFFDKPFHSYTHTSVATSRTLSTKAFIIISLPLS